MAAVQDSPAHLVRLVVRIHPWLPNLILALAGGIALRGVMDLTPLWWLAWLAPVPLIVAVVRARSLAEALMLATLAGLIGASVNLDYMRSLMGVPGAVGVMLLQALAWTLVLGGCLRPHSRRDGDSALAGSGHAGMGARHAGAAHAIRAHRRRVRLAGARVVRAAAGHASRCKGRVMKV